MDLVQASTYTKKYLQELLKAKVALLLISKLTQIPGSLREVSLDVLVFVGSCSNWLLMKTGHYKKRTSRQFVCFYVFPFYIFFFLEEHAEYAPTMWIISPKYTVVPWILAWSFRHSQKELRTTIWKRLPSTSLPFLPWLCLIYPYSGEKQPKGRSWH